MTLQTMSRKQLKSALYFSIRRARWLRESGLEFNYELDIAKAIRRRLRCAQ